MIKRKSSRHDFAYRPGQNGDRQVTPAEGAPQMLDTQLNPGILGAWCRGLLDDRDPAEDRAADTWEPLVAVADHAGAHWPDHSRASLATGLRSAKKVESMIGERIRMLRRGVYTQNDLAAAADVSVDVIRKLEQGRRHTASIATLQRIAGALGVELAALLGPTRVTPATGADQPQVIAIRDALTSVDDLLGELDGADAPDLTELSRSVTYAWGLYWAGRFEPLAAILPRLLAEAAAATHDATVPEAGRVAELGECGLDLPEARIISVYIRRDAARGPTSSLGA
jgi:transcriptional regulator with XRE-family HTH domain